MKTYKTNSVLCIGTLLGADFACPLFMPEELPMPIP
jgi:hypothetical protein